MPRYPHIYRLDQHRHTSKVFGKREKLPPKPEKRKKPKQTAKNMTLGDMCGDFFKDLENKKG